MQPSGPQGPCPQQRPQALSPGSNRVDPLFPLILSLTSGGGGGGGEAETLSCG